MSLHDKHVRLKPGASLHELNPAKLKGLVYLGRVFQLDLERVALIPDTKNLLIAFPFSGTHHHEPRGVSDEASLAQFQEKVP